MRHVIRDAELTPSIFSEPEIRSLKRMLITTGEDAMQHRSIIFKIQEDIRLRAKSETQNIFFSKCAYCESPVESGDGVLDWFRPLLGAERERGRVDRDHYSWLVTEWGNLYFTCKECNAYKKNLFPIGGSSKFGSTLNQLRKLEKAQLLDPCFDRPEQHLVIDSNGAFVPKSNRGNTTIEILNLNRSELVSSRYNAIKLFQEAWKNLFQFSHHHSPEKFKKIEQLLSHEMPFVGAIYIYFWQFLNVTHKRILTRFILTGPYLNGLRTLSERLMELPPIDDYGRVQRAYFESLEIEERTHFKYRPIKTVLIEQFKGIASMVIEFPLPSDSGGSWIAIVGENAAGKSSVLQAIALALVGPKAANKMMRDAYKLVSEGESEARIKISFWGTDETNTLQINARSGRFSGNAERPSKTFGYGPYRLLAKRELGRTQRGMSYRLKSLFDESVKLNGHHGWIQNLNEKQAFDAAATIEQLLALRGASVRIEDGTIRIATNGRPHPLGGLSSGVQSVVSMCTDLMEALYDASDSVLSGEAVILIDELDAHLHPSWRLGIVERLTHAFPGTHFIFSTHDPLTLRGLSAEQIQILKRDSNGEIKHKRADGYSDLLDIDQILTSDIFGLNSTLTSELDRDLRVYYELLGRAEQNIELSKDEAYQLENLAVRLDKMRLVGGTKRERIMYQILDKELATDQGMLESEWDPRAIDRIGEIIRARLNDVKLQ